MDEKREVKTCGYCVYMLMDTSYRFPRYFCDHYKRRIDEYPIPVWCTAFKEITAADLSPVETKAE